jgi:hypothetical protein
MKTASTTLWVLSVYCIRASVYAWVGLVGKRCRVAPAASWPMRSALRLQTANSVASNTNRRIPLAKREAPSHGEGLPSTRTTHDTRRLQTRPSPTAQSRGNSMNGVVNFRAGTPVVVEVINFGPLGASVHVIGIGEHLDGSNDNLPPWFCETERTLAKGIILQGEIHLFRQSRRYIDVRRGEVLNAYVERIRNVDSSDGLLKLDICLRSFGSLSKANEASSRIWNRLQQLQRDTNWPDVSLPIGTRSRREEIGRFFPGMSKVTFKRAIAVLEEQEQLEVNDYSIRLVDSGAIALAEYHP